MEDRLSHIEASIQAITAAVQGLTSAVSARGISQPNNKLIPLRAEDHETISHDSPGEVIEGEDGSSCYVGSLATGSFLPLATGDLKQYQQAENVVLPLGATAGLLDLSKTFASGRVNDDVKSAVEKARRDRELFYIPSQAEASKLIRSMSLISISLTKHHCQTPFQDFPIAQPHECVLSVFSQLFCLEGMFFPRTPF